jgi:PAS domain S-box-containing protein
MSQRAKTLFQRFQLGRYLAPVLTTVVLGVVVTTLVAYFYTKRNVEDLAQGQIAQALSFLDREISLQAQGMIMQTRLMAQEEVLPLALQDSYLGQSAQAAAQRKFDVYVRTGVFDRVYLMDLEGRLVLATDPSTRKDLVLADRNYFIQARAGHPTLETVPVSRVSGRPVLASATPVRAQDGSVLGVVVGILNTDTFARETLNNSRIGKHGGAYIVTGEGFVLGTPAWAAPGAFGGDVADGRAVPQTATLLASAQSGATQRYTRNDNSRICLVKSNEVTGWLLVLEADEGEVLAPAARLATVSGAISLVTLFVVVLALGALRRTMANLRNSEADHRTLTELSPVGILTFGPSGRPEYMNRQARRILDIGPDEPPPLTIALEDSDGALLSGDGSPIFRALREHASILGLLTWYSRPNGERRALQLNATPLVVEQRQAHGVVATLEDVTERMQALELLHQSEERFSSLFRLSPDSIVLSELDTGVVVDVNETFSANHGLHRDAVVGKTVEELGLYTDKSQFIELMQRIRQDGFVKDFEAQGRNATGEEITLSLSSQVVEIGGKSYRITVARDVTERKEQEERLRQSEERFSRLFRFSPEAMTLVDLKDSVFTDANEAFLRLTGYSARELLGKDTRSMPFYVDEASRETINQRLERDGHVENFEFEGRRKDGQILQCSISCHVIGIAGRRYILALVRDITEIKKMQEVMVQTEKMISVGGIAAGIAHEINNPLGIVLQAAQNLVQRTRPDFKKNIEVAAGLGLEMELLRQYMQARKLDVFIEDIQTAAMRASAIIRHMLDFSRSSESRRKVCDLPGIIDKAVTLAGSDYDLKKSYDFKRIKIVRDYADDLPTLSCTETEIEQVLLNLLRNSAQALATAEQPVDDPRIDIRAMDLGEYVRIEIEDNGPGMPPEVQRRVFEPFYTTKPPGVGTGLGLSVSYFIITKGHGGRMTVASSPGEGTLFRIELPTEHDVKDAA